ncbi:MAG: FAD-dependent oxidoreductase [Clostridia bacterium]|nr:FAD-dependent oxidoreductase [Clostridia bacterium]
MANSKDRICIIGGGPAGLACGMYLEKKGYENYTIYEKLNKVGGKAWSPKLTVTHNGVTEEKSFETGAIMGAITYHAVSEMEEFGGYYHKGPDFKPGEPNMRREFRKLDGRIDDWTNPKVDFSFKKLVGLLKLKKQMKKLNELMQTKYVGYDCYGHIGVAKGEYFGISKGVDGHCGATTENSFPNYIKGTNPNLKDLALPFSEFCKLNHVEEVQRIWIAPFTSFGYGYFDEIPAALVMKYLDVTTALEFVKLRLWTWQDGTQQIYEHVNAKLKHPAILQTEVVKVERPDGKVLVTTRDAKGKEKTEEFDKLIVTTPLDYFKNYADATDEEKELFSKIVHERYIDYIATFEEGKSPNISGYMVENMTPERLGHAMVYYNRWQCLDRDCPATVYALANHTGDPDKDYDEVQKTMDEDMARVGFPIKDKHFAQEVYYCPHVSCEDYANGWYDRLEALQGNKNTFYAGEIISFGDMEDTCAASKDIVGRFF